jgi:hypothetical protein
LEFKIAELLTYILGKTGTQRYNSWIVIYRITWFAYRDCSNKVHFQILNTKNTK